MLAYVEWVPRLLMSSGFLVCLCRVGSSFAYVEWVPHLFCRVASSHAYVEWVPHLLIASGFLAC